MKQSIVFDFLEEQALPFDLEEAKIIIWLKSVALAEEKIISKLQYHFCSDYQLLDLNLQYLQHDTLTDIITFPYDTDPIEAEIYISLDRVTENAKTYSNGDYFLELNRVLVHGLLHMCGYSDHSLEEQEIMRYKESHYLEKLNS